MLDDALAQWPLDGEEWAEFAAERLRDMAPALRERGVDLKVEVVSQGRDSSAGKSPYVIAINGTEIELVHDYSEDRDPWYQASVRPLAVLNDQLAAAGST